MNLIPGCDSRWNGRAFGRSARSFVAAGALALAVFASGCASRHTPGAAFASPDAAVDSVVTALRGGNRAELERIFGSDADQILSSGDAVADANGAESFLKSYDEKHRITPAADGAMQLEVGATDWPLPIPLVKDNDGWRFDTAAGLDEMLSRRIGRNELDTIETCRAISDAQRDYLAANPSGASPPAYARKFVSTPGSRDGLYWAVGENEPMSPLGDLIAAATEEGYTTARSESGEPQPLHGYYFRMLTAQGKFAPGGAMSYLAGDRLTKGFAAVAYPAEYGNSGIQTFIVNHLGIVYQRDLGEGTTAKAKAMTAFDPSPEWKVVEEVDVVEVR